VPTHDAVGARECAVRREVKRGLVGTDRADLEGNRSAGELLVEVEGLDRAASFDLVQPVANAVHCAAELVAEPPAVAVVVAIGEQDVLGRPVLVKPLESLGGHHRVDEHALGEQEVGADVHVDLVVTCGPVPQAGGDLSHGAQPNAVAV
jgi:hypothetical protein